MIGFKSCLHKKSEVVTKLLTKRDFEFRQMQRAIVDRQPLRKPQRHLHGGFASVGSDCRRRKDRLCSLKEKVMTK